MKPIGSQNLTWWAKTKSLVSRANSRIILLLKLFEFQVPQPDLVNIYKLFIRSILEQSCVVWHSAITKEEENDIERVQKVCLKIILKQDYISYEQALETVNLQTLVARREKLSLNFARKCLKNDKTKSMFPLRSCSRPPSKRNPEKFQVQHSRTTRLAKSAIPYLQRLLNQHGQWVSHQFKGAWDTSLWRRALLVINHIIKFLLDLQIITMHAILVMMQITVHNYFCDRQLL